MISCVTVTISFKHCNELQLGLRAQDGSTMSVTEGWSKEQSVNQLIKFNKRKNFHRTWMA